VGRTPADAVEFAEIDNSVGEMPKPARGQQGRTAAVEQLITVIEDKRPHRIQNVDDDSKDRWSRKLRYAARLAEKDVEIVYVSPARANEEREAGLYFKGYDKGEAPKRGLRK